jgi:hypothetical protein
VVSLGYAADGKRIRKKVSGQTRTEVKDKLKALHSELDAGVRTVQTSFVSKMIYQGVPVEEIARLAGHASSRTTEVVCRREPRPAITTGAEIIDQISQPKQRREAPAETAS